MCGKRQGTVRDDGKRWGERPPCPSVCGVLGCQIALSPQKVSARRHDRALHFALYRILQGGRTRCCTREKPATPLSGKKGDWLLYVVITRVGVCYNGYP